MDDLTDLEVCKRIAILENKYDELLGKQASYNSRLVHVQEKANITRWFNPLADKALCFDLMVKHEIDFHPLRCGMGVYHKAHWEIHLNGGDFEEFSCLFTAVFEISRKNGK